MSTPKSRAVIMEDGDEIKRLRRALVEIASHGPVPGSNSAGALMLRLVGSQAIARAALAGKESPVIWPPRRA